MSFAEIVILSPGDALLIVDILAAAGADHEQTRVAIDAGGLKLSVSRRTWTPPIGRPQHRD